MLMTAVPSERAFQSMVRLNQLKNFPLTHNNVKNALTIYGHDLANTRGKQFGINLIMLSQIMWRFLRTYFLSTTM